MKILAAIILLSVLIRCSSNNSYKTGHEGKTLPPFKLLLLDSITYLSTSTILSNKPAIILYITPNCPYCKAQIEEITNNIKLFKEVQFLFLTTFPIEDLRQLSSHFRLENFPNIKVGRDYNNFIGQYFLINTVPFIAVYDRNKFLKKAFIGLIYSNQLKKTLGK